VQVLRTPDDRFVGLPDYDFEPHYTDVTDRVDGTVLRVHHVDEGPAGAAPVLCLHGEPSWSYLYRHMVGPLVDAGHRVVAPDLVGFGRSDKPAAREDYTYQRHVDWMTDWLVSNDLRDITLVCQDWGGLIGLRLVTALPDRFDRVVVANTLLPTGDTPIGDGFLNWRTFSQEMPEFHSGLVLQLGTATELSDDVVAAYDAPFPDEAFTAGPRQFPMLVPVEADDPAAEANRAAWAVLETWDKPMLCAYSDHDPVTGGFDRDFLDRVPGTRGQPHTTIAGGGHFLQEDRGPELAATVNAFIAATPVP
jgi:haloalkane dehalogenase